MSNLGRWWTPPGRAVTAITESAEKGCSSATWRRKLTHCASQYQQEWQRLAVQLSNATTCLTMRGNRVQSKLRLDATIRSDVKLPSNTGHISESNLRPWHQKVVSLSLYFIIYILLPIDIMPIIIKFLLLPALNLRGKTRQLLCIYALCQI